MLVSTRLIKEAFGIGEGFGVESINIFESLHNRIINMLSLFLKFTSELLK